MILVFLKLGEDSQSEPDIGKFAGAGLSVFLCFKARR
jgi:hypothetical protein